MKTFTKSLISLLLILNLGVSAQQNNNLFHMHYLGQSNFLNPAVQSECKWFIGMPVLSSVHFNFTNSATSYNQLVSSGRNGSANLNIDDVVDNLGRRTLISAELHISLLALGYKRGDYYFNFAATEKINLPMTLSRDMFTLFWDGNTQFEGADASTRGTAFYFNHYREYAFGVSKKYADNSYWGLKAKILFGKFNISFPNFDIDLYTDPSTFELSLSSDILINMSAPLIIDEDNGYINSFSTSENIQPLKYLLNRKNPGLAIDAGIIHALDDKITLSASIIDLGFIRWRSDVNNLISQTSIGYQGVLVDSGNIGDAILDTLYFDITQDPYFTMLPTKAYLGIEYQLTRKVAARGLGSAVFYRTKMVPALTLSLDVNPFWNLHLVGSYSVMYRAYNNFGLGFSMGREPVQFYMISDNAWGFVKPLSARNFNLRFGLNINLGCSVRKKENVKGRTPGAMPCPAYANPLDRKNRNQF